MSYEDMRGGHLRFATATSPETLNPLQYTGGDGYILGRWLYSNLTRLTSDTEVEPDLATEWSANSDASVWTFQLRDDATFQHNGETVTADDVAATFNAIYAEDSSSPGQGSIGPIDTVEATGEFEVEFTMAQPFADLPKTLTSQWGRILPREIIEGDREQLANDAFGSGPFVLEEYSVGDEAVLSRNEDYYETDEDGNALPYISELSMSTVPEENARLTGVQNSEIDLLNEIGPSQVDRVRNMEGTTMMEKPSGTIYPIVMRTTAEPFDDLRVRQAIKYAVDREAMLEGAAQGNGVIAQDNPVSPAHEFHTDLDNKFGDTAEIEQAQQLLSDAGYGDGIELDFPLYSPSGNAAQIGTTAVLFQEQMSEVGIEFEIQEISWDNFLADIETQAEFYVSWYAFRPTEIQILSLLFEEGGVFYGTQWHETHPDTYEPFIENLDDVAAETEPDARQEIYTGMQQTVRDQGAIVIPFFQTLLAARKDYVTDYDHEPTGTRVPMTDTYLDADAPTK
jgi:peptide/nickel transport system substrate-binding protein